MSTTAYELKPQLLEVCLDNEQSVRELAHVVPYLTANRFAAYVRQEASRYMAVFDDPVMLTDEACVDGKCQLVVQHKASGLRAKFTWTEGEQLGVVLSKSYEIDSLDEGDHGDTTEPFDRYGGLGIGRKIYRHAGELHPGLRWLNGVGPSRSGAGVRRALHKEDPYRWQPQDCDWCPEQARQAAQTTGNPALRWWDSADRAAFNDHPRP